MIQKRTTTRLVQVSITGMAFIMMSATFFNTTAHALRIRTAGDVDFDTSILREDPNYNLPQRIVIAPLYAPSGELQVREEDWYRGIYYYTVDILGFNDIPFHFLVSKTGNIYKGNQGGYERKISVGGIGDGIILIGYMTDKYSSRIDGRAIDDLKELLIKISSENNIRPENIQIEGISFVRNEESRTVTLQRDDLFGSWNVQLVEIVTAVNEAYLPVEKKYNVTVDSVTLPETTVTPGENITVSVTVTNASETGLYGGTSSEILITKTDGNNSNFYVNNIWSSRTQLPIMEPTAVLQPFESKTYSFSIRVPLIVGQYKETFDIRNANGTKISDHTFDITLNIERSDKTIVEIIPTETGLLNVRSEPSSVGSVVSQVSVGERYFLVEDAGNGWIKIDLGDGLEGWIASWYTREV